MSSRAATGMGIVIAILLALGIFALYSGRDDDGQAPVAIPTAEDFSPTPQSTFTPAASPSPTAAVTFSPFASPTANQTIQTSTPSPVPTQSPTTPSVEGTPLDTANTGPIFSSWLGFLPMAGGALLLAASRRRR